MIERKFLSIKGGSVCNNINQAEHRKCNRATGAEKGTGKAQGYFVVIGEGICYNFDVAEKTNNNLEVSS